MRHAPSRPRFIWPLRRRLMSCKHLLAAGFATAALALVVAGSDAAEAPGLHQGTLDGADYLISIPPEWGGGGLVMFAHGYEGEGGGPGNAHVSPFDSYLTHRGIAWAASGYRSKGYR